MCDVHLERKKAKQQNKAQAKSGVQVCFVPVIYHVVWIACIYYLLPVIAWSTDCSLSVLMPNVEKFSFSSLCLSVSTNTSGELSYCSRLTSALSDCKAEYSLTLGVSWICLIGRFLIWKTPNQCKGSSYRKYSLVKSCLLQVRNVNSQLWNCFYRTAFNAGVV